MEITKTDAELEAKRKGTLFNNRIARHNKRASFGVEPYDGGQSEIASVFPMLLTFPD
ncbi:hypothetical protein ElyMa_001606100 [Elysia marginata]|uniref:Uncharacterized protein n=1 Tax=Elysia marginata TaxID=1093978 RepID=A0AAV4JH08_9GAST|nr:hypothetical protein ElyMa_001606100 [Elysia marginata]